VLCFREHLFLGKKVSLMHRTGHKNLFDEFDELLDIGARLKRTAQIIFIFLMGAVMIIVTILLK
jgi:hypothetical protein